MKNVQRLAPEERAGSGERPKIAPDDAIAEGAAPSSSVEVRRSQFKRIDARRLTALPSTATRQFDLCVFTPIITHRLEKLTELLDGLRKQTIDTMHGKRVDNPLLDWQAMGSIHYARFVIIEAHEAFGSGPVLAFSTNYDGPLGADNNGFQRAQREHLAEVVSHAGAALDTIYRCCEGYSGLNGMADYLATHHVPASTFYVGGSGRCRDQVLAEADLREQVQGLLDDLYRSEPELTPEVVRERVREQLLESGLDLPSFPAQPNRQWRVYAIGVATIGGGLALLGTSLGSGIVALQVGAVATVLLTGLAVILFRKAEKEDPQFEPKNSEAQREHLATVAADENLFLQNELSHLVDIKPGLLRRTLLGLVFAALKLLTRNYFNKGKLGNIPSIHFARWCRIDGGRRVLFFSNFDNSWESYLGDFVDQASLGLTGVWSNTVGYPRSRWLVFAGSRAARRFKAWTRHHQIRTQVWYSAYPNLSVRTVNANTEIRRGLAQTSGMSARVWLDWLQNVDRKAVDAQYQQESKKSLPQAVSPEETARGESTERAFDAEDIQGLILHGYGAKKGAQFLMLRVAPGRASTVRNWLSELELTHAEYAQKKHKRPDPFVNLAFTYKGFVALDLEQELLSDFPVEFVQGAADDMRCRINGDVGVNDPNHWRWGAQQSAVHAVLLVYAATPAMARDHAQHLLNDARNAGLQLVEMLEGGELEGRKEHFGFRDGIAQPVVQGSGKRELVGNTVPMGEFLLGYTNAYRDTAYAPQSAQHENFGRNGSYLVFRQLSQDVPAFWRYCEKQAVALGSDAITVASKMVGRWPSGASLVKHPQRDPNKAEFENEDRFAYLAQGEHNDRDGASCPFGSHLRRTNPRDWETGESRERSVELANRHRIIRRGRPYGEALTRDMSPGGLLQQAKQGKEQPVERGLQFLAFGANIQRQFEFVQQQWSQNPAFAGQSNCPDAVNAGFAPSLLDGQGSEPSDNDGPRREATFTIQADTSKASFGRCLGLTQFVRVMGCAYFFMPSLATVRALKTD